MPSLPFGRGADAKRTNGGSSAPRGVLLKFGIPGACTEAPAAITDCREPSVRTATNALGGRIVRPEAIPCAEVQA